MGWLYLSSESHHFLEAPLSKPPPFVHVCAQSLQSCLPLCDPLTVACQAPLSMEFSRKECWSVLACPPLGDCPYPGIKPTSPTLAGRVFTTESPGKPISLSRYQQWLPLLFAFRPTSGHSQPQGPGSGQANSHGFLHCFCLCPSTLVFSEIILASTSPHRMPPGG